MIKKFLLTVVAALGLVAAAPAFSTVVTGTYTWTGTEASGPNRLFRNAIPSVAASPKPFPGTSGNNPTFFMTWEFDAAPGTLITFVTDGTNAGGIFNSFFSAYTDDFDPLNLAANYLADAGSSDLQTWTAFAPSSGHFILVDNSLSGRAAIGSSSSYSVTFTEAVTAVPEPGSLALLGLGLAGLAAIRKRKQA